MLRKTMVALMAMVSVSILTVDAASAQRSVAGFHGGGGGFHGGGGGLHGGGGGFHGGAVGMGGGGFRGAAIGGGGFRSAAIGGAPFRHGFAAAPSHGGFQHGFRQHHQRFPIGATALGFGLDYGAWRSYYDSGYPYFAGHYDDAYYYDGGCYIVRQRVLPRFGWRIRPVQVCG